MKREKILTKMAVAAALVIAIGTNIMNRLLRKLANRE